MSRVTGRSKKQTRSSRLLSQVSTYTAPFILRRQIRRIVRSGRPIIVGPWVSEVGFELLYWIPFLRWINAKYGLPKERAFFVSRGGTEKWYGDLCGAYFDILDLLSPEEFNHENERRIVDQGGGRKHYTVSQLDRKIIEATKQRWNLDRVSVLHPSLMYRLFRPFWLGEDSIRFLQRHTEFKALSRAGLDDIARDLPSDYVAVKFYSSNYLPDTLQNQSHIADLMSQLTGSTDVVSLDTGLNIDEHQDYHPGARGHVFSIKHLIKPSNNLDIQTRVVGNAKAFVGTYGGFSYLAPLLGVPSVSFYSEGQKLATHMYVAARAFSQFNPAPYLVLDIKDLDVLPLVSGSRAGLRGVEAR